MILRNELDAGSFERASDGFNNRDLYGDDRPVEPRVEPGTRGLRFAKLDRLDRTLGVPVTDLVAVEEVAPKGSVVARLGPGSRSVCSACCPAS